MAVDMDIGRVEMAFTRQLEARRLEELRGELGYYLSAHPHPALGEGALFIGEGFETYSLSVDGIARAAHGVDLAACLVKTGNWQHQILRKGQPAAIAYSGTRGDMRDSWHIRGVVVSPAAAKIDRAIQRIDRQRPEDKIEVFFFIAPAFQLQAFLLKGFSAEEVFIVLNPFRSGLLDEGFVYSPSAMATALSTSKPAQGVTAPTAFRK